MKKKVHKTFDCVEMKRRIQEKIAEETKGMTPSERLAHLKRRVAEGPFAELLEEQLSQSKPRRQRSNSTC